MDKNNKPIIIISDFDGVIGDSLKTVLKISKNIAELYGCSVQIKEFSDYYKLFGRSSLEKIVTLKDSILVEKLLRSLMNYHSSTISLFQETVNIYSNLIHQSIIVTSSESKLVRKLLGKNCTIFKYIYGCENGSKFNLLSKLNQKYFFYYVTDTVRDIEICKELAIPVIATGWGYEKFKSLKNANPDFIVKDFKEIQHLFGNLKLLKNGEKT